MLFRLAAGVWMARLVILWRLTIFRTWGVSLEELIELLDDTDPQVRRNAAVGLGQSGSTSAPLHTGLDRCARDLDPQVRCMAAQRSAKSARLRELPSIRSPTPRGLDSPNCVLPPSKPWGESARRRVQLPSLILLLRVSDAATATAIIVAVDNIAPSLRCLRSPDLALCRPAVKRASAMARPPN